MRDNCEREDLDIFNPSVSFNGSVFGFLFDVIFSYLGLTQLVEGWGCLGGQRPPKHPQFSLELRNFYIII